MGFYGAVIEGLTVMQTEGISVDLVLSQLTLEDLTSRAAYASPRKHAWSEANCMLLQYTTTKHRFAGLSPSPSPPPTHERHAI